MSSSFVLHCGWGGQGSSSAHTYLPTTLLTPTSRINLHSGPAFMLKTALIHIYASPSSHSSAQSAEESFRWSLC
jgi:hypothetical protein